MNNESLAVIVERHKRQNKIEMRIIIFGASSLTGIELTKLALDKGHYVTAFVRNPEKFHIHNPNLSVVKGNVTDTNAVERAIANQDVAICALGAKSPFRNDFSIIEGIKNIVSAMETQSVKRFVYLSFIGLDDNRKELGFLANRIMPIVLRKVIQDHTAKEKIIVNSRLDWTIVRAPKLTNDKSTGKYRAGERILPNSLMIKISRKDLAEFMLSAAGQNQYIKQKPRIMY